MTPKEKAEELINKMYNTEHCGIKHFPNKNYCDCIEMNMFQAKQCALIAVDEKIYTCWKFYTNLQFPVIITGDEGYIYFKREIQYLEEVKKEIELL